MEDELGRKGREIERVGQLGVWFSKLSQQAGSINRDNGRGTGRGRFKGQFKGQRAVTCRWIGSGERGLLTWVPGQVVSGLDKRFQPRRHWRQWSRKSAERSCNNKLTPRRTVNRMSGRDWQTGKRPFSSEGPGEQEWSPHLHHLASDEDPWEGDELGSHHHLFWEGDERDVFSNVMLPSSPLILRTISLLLIWQRNPLCTSLEAWESGPSARRRPGTLLLSWKTWWNAPCFHRSD